MWKNQFLNFLTNLKSVDTIVNVATTSTSNSKLFTTIGMMVILISNEATCGLAFGEKNTAGGSCEELFWIWKN